MKKKNVRTASEYVDQDTLDLLSARDPQILTKIFVETNPYLMRVCRTNGVHGEHIDEVIHATWERFFSNIEKFEARSKIRTFVCGILLNKIREYRRAQKRLVLEEDSDQVLSEAFTKEGWWKTVPHDPQRLLELKEATMFMKECLEGLTDQQRTAFVMREVEDENSEVICLALDINVSHLRVVLFRAKDKLRQCLEGRVSR